jgi:alcohol dehydrogenase class IV
MYVVNVRMEALPDKVDQLVAPLGGRCRVPHGLACASLLPETLTANLRALRERAPGSPALSRLSETAALFIYARMT